MLNRAIGGAYGFTTDIGGFFDVGPYSRRPRSSSCAGPSGRRCRRSSACTARSAPATHTPWTYDARDGRASTTRSRALHRRARPLILRLWRGRAGPGSRRRGRCGWPTRATRGPRAQDQEWLLGPDVLVAPVVVEGAPRARSTSRAAAGAAETGGAVAARRAHGGGAARTACPTSSAAARGRSRPPAIRRRARSAASCRSCCGSWGAPAGAGCGCGCARRRGVPWRSRRCGCCGAGGWWRRCDGQCASCETRARVVVLRGRRRVARGALDAVATDVLGRTLARAVRLR